MKVCRPLTQRRHQCETGEMSVTTLQEQPGFHGINNEKGIPEARIPKNKVMVQPLCKHIGVVFSLKALNVFHQSHWQHRSEPAGVIYFDFTLIKEQFQPLFQQNTQLHSPRGDCSTLKMAMNCWSSLETTSSSDWSLPLAITSNYRSPNRAAPPEL